MELLEDNEYNSQQKVKHGILCKWKKLKEKLMDDTNQTSSITVALNGISHF